MKNNFVLDAGIIRSSAICKDEKGMVCYHSNQLILNIAKNNHHIIITKIIMYKKYIPKIEELKGSGEYVSFQPITFFIHLMENSDIIKWDVVDNYIYNDEYDKDDIEFVSLTIKNNAILSTLDDRLINALNKADYKRRYLIQYKRPENCLADST